MLLLFRCSISQFVLLWLLFCGGFSDCGLGVWCRFGAGLQVCCLFVMVVDVVACLWVYFIVCEGVACLFVKVLVLCGGFGFWFLFVWFWLCLLIVLVCSWYLYCYVWLLYCFRCLLLGLLVWCSWLFV